MIKFEEKTKQILQELDADIKSDNIYNIENLRIKYLGRKSELSKLLKDIKNAPKEKRKNIGLLLNRTKNAIQTKLEKIKEEIEKEELDKSIKKDKIDITEPGIRPTKGNLHPITKLLYKSIDIFTNMGFEVYEPYQIDDDYNNFESINIPKEHPARDAWDTFWTEDGQILITHTSSMQNRILSSKTPPIRAVVPGRCFRNEATDARHEHTFHQIEGVYVDKQITFTDMLGTLQTYFEAFFEKEIKVKFMPDYFPFVEPGGQIALSCVLCNGKGCKVCKNSGWLEILGCGMIHPNVLKEAGIDPNIYTGFAWGFGLERLIMLKNGIDDIRLFHSGDIRFIKQFK